MTEGILLIGDIGGTNARFALAKAGQPGYSDDIYLKCSDYAEPEQAIRSYIDRVGIKEPEIICLAIAGPINDRQARMTNNAWIIDAEKISHAFNAAHVHLINDFTAIAHSIPSLRVDDSILIGPATATLPTRDDFSLGVIGPGTGLGTAGLIRRNGQLFPITTEAGHTGFAPETQQQIDLLITLKAKWPRVSNERLLSGNGIENIYWALRQNGQKTGEDLSAGEIFVQAGFNTDSLAYQAVEVFFEVLGQVAGDIALSLGAENGIYLAGGIVKRYPDLLKKSRFREAFENKGRHRAILENIPTRLITHSQPGLLGASQFIKMLQA